MAIEHHQPPMVSSIPRWDRLHLWLDPLPRSAFECMGMDEAILRSNLPAPILRFYDWSEPACSFGYSQAWDTIEPDLPRNVTPVRRWTAGGLVDHRSDITYSLIVPSAHPFHRLRPLDAYAWVHERLGEALAPAFEAGSSWSIAPSDTTSLKSPAACFLGGGWSKGDLLQNGSKLAGAARRRTRWGILHQGSLALPALPSWLPDAFAGALARETVSWQPSPSNEAEARRLATERYASKEWLHRV